MTEPRQTPAQDPASAGCARLAAARRALRADVRVPAQGRPGRRRARGAAHLDQRRSDQGPSDDNPRIPAGYTYLGQFIDHDITFDPTSQLGRDNDPSELVDVRTPRFDLDSLYGSGPTDQPFLYDWHCDQPGVKLLVGHNDGPEYQPVDLPRTSRSER